ncbi:helix-turn-helix transcriptional regulator [Labrenzia sp. DG1229]|uniref:helix-turn-helix domain-containing protein n=1 Tax=Labrenzia sp. DG1229 TaxID=681847 RepID=UPI0012EB92B9|nr:helix-turn-helix transcriptional regulator [Labrenzia sp. DG1229]
MTRSNRQSNHARYFDFSNIQNGNSASNLANDSSAHGVQNAHAMVKDRQFIIQKWLSKVIDEKAETQAAIASLLGLSSSQMNKTLRGTRNIKADELLIVAGYFDAELPLIPGHGQARISKRSNDNDVSGPNFSDNDDDELWVLAEKKVEDEEQRKGVRLTNEEYIDRIIKLYDTLSRRRSKEQ